MTQADVAEAMGTTQSVVSHFERLGGDARFSTVQRLHWHTSIAGGEAMTPPRTRPDSGVDTFYRTTAAQ